MTVSTTHSRIEGLLKKSLLGEELIDTQFHLYSARCCSSRKVGRPRALFANNVLLSESSDYFASLLNSNNLPSNKTLVDFDVNHPVYSETSFEDYGYASDSDLEDEDDPSIQAIVTPGLPKNSISQEKGSRSENHHGDIDDLVDSCMSQESLEREYDISGDAQDIFTDHKSVPSLDIYLPKIPALGLSREVGRNAQSRKIFVNDTAFKTWQALLLYLYMDKIKFKPLKSKISKADAEPDITPSLSLATDPHGPLTCSPKSMYRLASKIGLESLKRLAFDAIRAGLCGQNILRELTSSLTAKYPEILAMQLDVLHSNFASTFVEDGLPSLAKQISRGELLQGEQIILGICQRVRRDYYLAPEEPVSCEVEARTYTTPPPRMGVKKGNTRTFK